MCWHYSTVFSIFSIQSEVEDVELRQDMMTRTISLYTAWLIILVIISTMLIQTCTTYQIHYRYVHVHNIKVFINYNALFIMYKPSLGQSCQLGVQFWCLCRLAGLHFHSWSVKPHKTRTSVLLLVMVVVALDSIPRASIPSLGATVAE